jgi:hypothetical protein
MDYVPVLKLQYRSSRTAPDASAVIYWNGAPQPARGESIFIHTWRANQREPFSALLAHFIRHHKAFLCDKCNAARPFMNIALAARAMNFPSLNCRHKSATIKRGSICIQIISVMGCILRGNLLRVSAAARICHSNLWLRS